MCAATVMWTNQSYLPALALNSDTGNILSVKGIHRTTYIHNPSLAEYVGLVTKWLPCFIVEMYGGLYGGNQVT